MQPSSAEIRVLHQALRRMGLIAPDEQPQLLSLTGGVSSLIVRADTRRGPVCIKQALAELKVASHWSAPLERNHAEVAWMQLAMQVIPEAVPALLGEDAQSHAYAMQWLDPGQHPVWKAQLRDGVVDAGFAAGVARHLVRLHSASADQPALAEAFAHDRHFFALRLDPYFGATALLHADCAPALHALITRTASNKRALVHGDISPKNILAGPNGPIFLDAECAWYGDPAFDPAFCLCHLLAKCLWQPQHMAAYLASFDAFAEAYLQGVQWEARADIEERIAHLLPGLMLARVDGKSPLEYLNDANAKERMRRFARQWLLQPGAQLASLRRAWETLCSS